MEIRDLLIRLSGHDPRALDGYDRCDRQALVHTGWTVIPPLIVTFLNWTGAGIVLSLGAGRTVAIFAGLIFGAVGFLVVFVFDRAALYHMDTRVGSARAKYALVAIRVIIILLISSLTTQAIVPILMRPELAQEALRMRERSDDQRIQKLAVRYDVAGRQATLDRADADVAGAKRALAVVPPAVQQHVDAARQCWVGYEHRRARMLSRRTADTAVRRSLATNRARCSGATSSAQRELASYRQNSRLSLANAKQHVNDAKTSLDEAATSLKAKTDEAAKIEQSALVPQSALVQHSLLKNNSGARQKWWTIYLVILFIEIMALFLKLMAGPSILGTRIAMDRRIASESCARRRRVSAQEMSVEDELREMTTAARLSALSSEDVQDHAARLFAGKIDALVPVHVFQALVREIEAGKLDFEDAIRRHPDCVRVISEAWRKTIEEVADRLRSTQAYPKRTAA